MEMKKNEYMYIYINDIIIMLRATIHSLNVSVNKESYQLLYVREVYKYAEYLSHFFIAYSSSLIVLKTSRSIINLAWLKLTLDYWSKMFSLTSLKCLRHVNCFHVHLSKHQDSNNSFLVRGMIYLCDIFRYWEKENEIIVISRLILEVTIAFDAIWIPFFDCVFN